MKRFVLLVLLPTLLLFGCSKEEKRVRLQEGTPAYLLAKDLVPILPWLDPGVNAVMIRTNTFTVTTGEVIQTLYANMGKRTEQLKTFDAKRLGSIFDENATRLAERKLLLAEANKAKSSVTPIEIQNILDLQYRRAGGEEKFLQYLEENGIDLEFVKESIAKDVKIENYLKGYFADKIPVSEEDIQIIYARDKTATVRHILLSTQNKTDQEKQEIHKKMEGILSRAKSGEDFAELAKTYTEDPGSKDNGGLYENFGRGQTVPPFEEASFSVPIGEISDIVETSFGYHIIKVIDRKKETRPLDEVRTEIEAQIRRTKQNAVYQELLTLLKDKASLQIIQY
jgi:parvulin-like peptidyl-prolyl isomerase